MIILARDKIPFDGGNSYLAEILTKLDVEPFIFYYFYVHGRLFGVVINVHNN